MSMRIKAADSLKRLKELKTKKRKSVIFNAKHAADWHRCPASDGLQEYIKLVSWCNSNVSKKYSRGEGAFWFEDEKDAFKFTLKFGTNDD